MHDPLDLADVLIYELDQLRESGFDVSAHEHLAAEIHGMSDSQLAESLALLERVQRTPTWPFEEPSDAAGIAALLPPVEAPSEASVPSLQVIEDRIRGAWLGRCVGCALGKPVEGWTSTDIRRHLTASGVVEIEDYLPAVERGWDGPEMKPSWTETTRGRVAYMPRDDDVDYTILGLHILEQKGLDFAPDDVLDAWLSLLPFTRVFTAERTAYRNAIYGLRPPETAIWRNPYREWIGAMIRSDVYGFVAPTSARQAAWLAFKDASVSHTANGIYASMWAAALVWEGIHTGDAALAVRRSCAHVPATSRLHAALSEVVDLHAEGIGWTATLAAIQSKWGHLSWVHAINNAAVVAAALLHGHGDFTRSVGLAVQAGWDTDSTGATVGSVAGAVTGVAAIPSQWKTPLNDDLRNAVFGFERSSISGLAGRTLVLRRTLSDQSLDTASAQEASS